MRVERDHAGNSVLRLGALDYLAKDFPMSEMQAVEIAYRKDSPPPRRTEARPPFRR